MNSIETIICLILLLMAVPDVCRKVGRPALAYAFFVVFGLALTTMVGGDVRAMLTQAGQVGFLLVLFEVGLEIELAPLREFLPQLRFALGWMLIQFPLVLGLATVAGLTLGDALLAAAAITGCSLGMAHPSWKTYQGMGEISRAFVLHVMVALEMLAIISLSVGTVALERGFTWWILLRLTGIALAIYLISRFSSHLVDLCQWIIEKTTHWRVHFLVLLVLVVCALGERIGLSAAKTAFFLGLFMSGARHRGMNLEEYIAPISQRFLIPIFFVSLGMQIEAASLFSHTALLAFCGAFVLIGFREVVHTHFFKTGGDGQTHLLFGPNLTMAALAGTALLNAGHREAATWTVLVGLFVSVATLMFLRRTGASQSGQPSLAAGKVK